MLPCQTCGVTTPHDDDSTSDRVRVSGPSEQAPAEMVEDDQNDRDTTPQGSGRTEKHWQRWLVIGFVVVAILLVLIMVWTSFLPRWWAQTISRQTGGTFARGVGWGLFYGFTFTLAPLLVLALVALRSWRRHAGRIALAVLALLLALPNLVSLSVSLAPGRVNEIARQTLDVNAPWFRGASIIGAVIAALAAAGVWTWVIINQRRHRELLELRAERDERR